MTEAPQQFGKYRILGELGRGGFARVYRAVDTTLEREVALKILYPQLLADPTFVQRFRQEAKTLALLRHPYIVTIYEVSEIDGRIYIAMDMAHGLSLARSIAKRKRIPWRETLALLKPICEALDYAHGRSIIHRDLKPANVLLDRERGALLTDFGFARLMGESSVSMSMSGGIVGTPGYIAPEVWEENATDQPVDIYALGCIVYEMLTGETLFKGQTPMQAMRAHDRGPQFPETWPEDVPTNITAVLNKALARSPSDRYPGAGALWHALNNLEQQAQAAGEVTQRAKVAAQWRVVVERALAAKEWDAARMAIDRLRAVAPDDPGTREAQEKLERLIAQQPEVQPHPTRQPAPAAQEKVAADLRQKDTSPSPGTSPISQKPVQATPAIPDPQPDLPPAAKSGVGSKIVGGLGVLAIIVLLVMLFANNRKYLGNTSDDPTAGPSVVATTTLAQATTAPSGANAAIQATTAPLATAIFEPRIKGGTLKLLYWQAITILNPHQASGTKDFDASRLILEPLASWDDKGKLSANLVTEIPTIDNGGVSKDYKTTTWKLKPGIKWSDGSDFTANDVIFTWKYCADEATACTTKSNFDPIGNVEAPDPLTVKITWKEPNPNSYIAFVGPSGMILQQAQYKDCVGAAAAQCPANNAPIGTGPYKLKEFKSGDVVTYDKNPLYRDADKVAFDGAEIKGGGDAASAARAVCQTSEVDYGWNLQVEAAVLDEIVAGGNCGLVKPSLGIERLLFQFADPDPALGDKRAEPDTKNPRLSDVKVRQALSLAIDRKTMAEQIYGESGNPTCNILTNPPDDASPNTKCDQDVEGAKKLLDEAGWKDTDGDGIRDKDGVPLVLTFQTSINSLRQKEQALIKANWLAIGVETQLKGIDAGVYFSSDKGNPDTASHFFADVEMFTNSNSDPDPTTYFDGWTCAQIASKANNWNLGNNNRYCNKDYDAQVDIMKQSTDPAMRKAAFIKANDILVAQDYVVVPLIDRFTPSGYVKGLVGPTGPAFDSLLWNIATWSK